MLSGCAQPGLRLEVTHELLTAALGIALGELTAGAARARHQSRAEGTRRPRKPEPAECVSDLVQLRVLQPGDEDVLMRGEPELTGAVLIGDLRDATSLRHGQQRRVEDQAHVARAARPLVVEPDMPERIGKSGQLAAFERQRGEWRSARPVLVPRLGARRGGLVQARL